MISILTKNNRELFWPYLSSPVSFSVKVIDFSVITCPVAQHNVVSYCNVNGAAGCSVLNDRTVS